MKNLLTALGLFVLTCPMLGCGPKDVEPKVAAVVDVAGTVQLDGKPMADGDIAFSIPGGGPAIIKIKDGKFAGKCSAGEKRVEIRAYHPGQPIMMDGKPTGDPVPENYIPAKFNSESTLKATVAATGTKDLKFDVVSK